jgi:formylglycine-generating enzyme required for sulfatase activity
VDALDRALSKELQATSALAEREPDRPRLLGRRGLLAAGVLLPLLAFPVYRVAFPPERGSAVTLPAGAKKLEDGIVADLNGRRFFKRIACRLPDDNEPIEFVLVPKEARDDPDSFYIMRNKVSVGLYRKFASAHPKKIIQKGWNQQQVGDEYPALGVGVEDAYHFAEWVHGNLPTTKEWDKAAGFYRPDRSEGPYKGAWGEGSKLKIAVDRSKPMPVGRAADDESPYGCRDMAGNGTEWTGSVASSDQRVPITNPERQYVWLRGQGYDAPEPLRYKDLEEAGSKKLISLRYRDTDFDVGFRVVIEP